MRALVIGHFSTVGDIESLRVAQAVLEDEAIPWDLLPFNPRLAPHLEGTVTAGELEPERYTHLIAVCGPLWPGLLARRGIELGRFAHCTRIGLNLTMVRPVSEWNPFHLLIERDSDRANRPDLTFLSDTAAVPVAGLCTIGRQREYGRRQRHGEAIARLNELIETRALARVEVDTRWPRHRNSGGLASPDQVMALISRFDVLLTNRLHGMVYALRAGVPVIAIDPIEGGDKVIAQAQALRWPAVARVDNAEPKWMERALDWCLADEGRAAAGEVAAAARASLLPVANEFRSALSQPFKEQPVPADPPGAVRLAARLARAFRSTIGG